MSEERQQHKQYKQQQEDYSYYHHQVGVGGIIPGRSNNRPRRIFQADEGHRSKKTAEKYRTNFRHFLDHFKVTDLDVFLDYGKEVIQEMVITYVISMRDNPDKKYARSTVNTDVAAILYFLDNNDIELNRHKIKRYYPSDQSVHDDRPYTTEEIQRMLAVSDPRSKTIILLMASSGVRIGALPSMQIGDLYEEGFDNFKLYRIQVYARTRDKYYTFCTPECYKAINEYLDYRARCGEEIKDRSPLLRRQFNRLDQFAANAPRGMAEDTVSEMINQALIKSGVRTPKNKETMRSHAFRKGFKSICERTGMKSLHVEMLLGHNTGLAKNYYRPYESDLLEDYMTHAADALTINPTHRLEKQVSKLESEKTEEIDRLKKQVSKLEAESNEDAKTKKQFNQNIAEIQELVEQQNQTITELSEYSKRSRQEATEIYRKAMTEMRINKT